MVLVHRIGFTQLGNNGTSARPYRANIVFVHGLRGHPRQTWADNGEVNSENIENIAPSKLKTFKSLFKSKPSPATSTIDGPSKATVFWPEEYLTEDIPDARVWTYGYNADVIGGIFEANNKNSVSQHGRDFAVKIEREIENEDPIIFVAHSLGGIIVKDAMRQSTLCRVRTKLIIFLGTPHRGASIAGWGEIMSNIARLALQDSNKEIIRTMKVNNEVLDNINDEFKTIIHHGDIKIHSFQEARGMSGMKGQDAKVVDDFSSRLDLPKSLETVETIDTDHRQMARCRSRNDTQYRNIVGVLRHFMRNMEPQILPLRPVKTGTTITAVREIESEPDDQLPVEGWNNFPRVPYRQNTASTWVKPNTSREKPKIRCHRCDTFGHVASACYASPGTIERGRKRREQERRCFHCGDWHWISDCPWKA